jgi:CHAT domain-containing protein
MVRLAAWLVAFGTGLGLAQPNAPATALVERAAKLQAAGDSAGALKLLREALPLCGGQDLDCQARARYGLGRAHTALGQHRDALDNYAAAVELRRRSGPAFELALALHNLAAAHWFLSESERAVEVYEEALGIRRVSGDESGIALTLYGIGAARWSMGQAQPALEAYREALALFRKQKNTFREADTLNSLGLVLLGAGDFDAAVEHYDQALTRWRELKNSPREAYTLNNLGMARLERNEPKRALELFQRALPLVQEPPDPRAIAYILHNLGDARAKLGDPRGALEHYSQSLDRKRSLGDRFGEAHSLHSTGLAHLALKNPAAARESLKQALDLRRDVADHSGEAETLAALASVHRFENEPEAARRRLEECLALVESARYDIVGESLRSSFLSSRHRYYDQLIDLLMEDSDASNKQERIAAAFEVAERARARALLDALGAARGEVRAGIDPGLLAEKRGLERRLRQASRTAAAAKTVNTLLDQWEEIEGRIRSRSTSYAELTRPSIASVRSVQDKMLDPATTLLEFFVGEQRGHAWVVSKQGVHAYALPGRTEIEAAARSFYEAVRGKAPASNGQRLASMLLGPARSHLSGGRLRIVADGILQYVPFAALPDPASPSHYLIEKLEIAYLPSASVALAGQQKAPVAGNQTLAVIADPVFDAGDARVTKPVPDAPAEFRRLRFSRLEAERILALVPKPQSLGALDFAAEKTLLTGTRLRGFRTIHLATHAVIDTKNPEWSRIVFSQVDAGGSARDGSLRLWEVYNLELDAGLVVLSACQSAIGPQVRGEGLLGLARGFLYAGARSAVASLWDVDDRSTAELMARFYDGYLRRRLTPSAALRQAQLQILRDARWSLPYYWAPFAAIGTDKADGGAGKQAVP